MVVELEKSFVGVKPTDLVTVTKMGHIVEVQYNEDFQNTIHYEQYNLKRTNM